MDNPLALRLRDALEKRGLAVREMARLLAGDNASKERIESVRGHLSKARRGKIGTVGEDTSRRWVEVLNQIPNNGTLPEDYFVIPAAERTVGRRPQHERLDALEQEVAEIRELVEQALESQDVERSVPPRQPRGVD